MEYAEIIKYADNIGCYTNKLKKNIFNFMKSLPKAGLVSLPKEWKLIPENMPSKFRSALSMICYSATKKVLNLSTYISEMKYLDKFYPYSKQKCLTNPYSTVPKDLEPKVIMHTREGDLSAFFLR